MPHVTRYFISPNFSHEKLDSPTYEDLVDVFEDRMRNWFLMPAERLLEVPHCQIAAVAILISYFEGIAIYLSGKDSKNKSFEFFADGFAEVFFPNHKDENASKIIARAIYDQASCGYVHDGLFRNRVFLSDVPSKPLIITFPKKNGELELTRAESIVINPVYFFQSIKNHFTMYLKKLRSENEIPLRKAFEAAVKLKWGLAEPEPAIGLTHERFFQI